MRYVSSTKRNNSVSREVGINIRTNHLYISLVRDYRLLYIIRDKYLQLIKAGTSVVNPANSRLDSPI